MHGCVTKISTEGPTTQRCHAGETQQGRNNSTRNCHCTVGPIMGVRAVDTPQEWSYLAFILLGTKPANTGRLLFLILLLFRATVVPINWITQKVLIVLLTLDNTIHPLNNRSQIQWKSNHTNSPPTPALC